MPPRPAQPYPSPLAPAVFHPGRLLLIADPGKPTMEMLVKKGKKIERYKSNGSIGGGDGEKVGIAYRMKDGSMVYVPKTS